MKHKALKKIEGGKSTQRVNIQKQKIKVQKLHLELLDFYIKSDPHLPGGL